MHDSRRGINGKGLIGVMSSLRKDVAVQVVVTKRSQAENFGDDNAVYLFAGIRFAIQAAKFSAVVSRTVPARHPFLKRWTRYTRNDSPIVCGFRSHRV